MRYIVDGETLVQRSDKRGIISNASGASAEVHIRDTIVYDNAGWRTTSPPIAGVGVDKDAVADLGTHATNDPGNNKICCNRNGQDTQDRDFHNKSETTINAIGNYWCGSADVKNEPTGVSVTDVSGALASDPHPHVSNTCTIPRPQTY